MRRKVGDTFTREMDWECSVDKLGQSRFNGTPFRRAKPERNCPRGLDLGDSRKQDCEGVAYGLVSKLVDGLSLRKGQTTHLVKSF